MDTQWSAATAPAPAWAARGTTSGVWGARSGPASEWSGRAAPAFVSVSTTTDASSTEIFVRDDFTTGAAGSLLSSREGTVGATWTELASYAFQGAGKLRISDAAAVYGDGVQNAEYYYASGVPPNANYYARATFRVKSVGDENQLNAPGILVRQSADLERGLLLHYQSGTAVGTRRWEIYEKDTGSATLVSVYTQALTAGQDYVAKLSVDGSTVTASIDSVVRMTGTLSLLTLAGRAAIRFYNQTAQGNTTGIHVTDFLAETLSSVVTTVTDTTKGRPSWESRTAPATAWSVRT